MRTTKNNPEADSQKLLKATWGSTLPVDPVQIAQQLGIVVLEANLPNDVSGALIRKIGQDPRILISRTDSSNRQRFSAAHELGHFVDRSNSSEQNDEYEYVDFRDGLARKGTDESEIYANRFAAALLMPRKAVEIAHENGLSPVEMALMFQVSEDAMRFRLATLKLL